MFPPPCVVPRACQQFYKHFTGCECVFHRFIHILNHHPNLYVPLNPPLMSTPLYCADLPPTAKPIDIVQGLEDLDIVDGGEALFECALSRPESKDCRWLLNGTPVKESPNAEIVLFESGRRHLLLLKELHMADSCTVTFQAGTASSSAELNVKSESAEVFPPLLSPLPSR